MPPTRKNTKMVSRRRRALRRNTFKRRVTQTRRSGDYQSTVHRRLVLFPKVDSSKWLQNLSWFAGIALKLFQLVSGVRDDLTATSTTAEAGSTIILGPGDFASFSPMATSLTPSETDGKEIKALRSFPFERASLHRVTARIVPSVDLGQRGGMYAAVLLPIDSIDSTIIEGGVAGTDLRAKFSHQYDDIIKHPRARLAPVTSNLRLSLSLPGTKHNIRSHYNGTVGYLNAYPTCALCIAFSDLAAKEKEVETQYGPAKSLFEVHLTGAISFHEPGDLSATYTEHEYQRSVYSCKIFSTDTNLLTHSYFGQQFEVEAGKPLDLTKIPFKTAKSILENYGREDLIEKLEAISSLKGMEI